MTSPVKQSTAIVCSTVCSSANQRKHQSSASLACVRGIRRWPVDSPHKGPVWVRSHVRFVRNRMACYIFIGKVSTGVVTWSALRCGACGESGKNVATDPLSKTAAAAAATKTWFAKLPLDYMLHNTFPWKRRGPRSAMWPPCSLWRNLSAAAAAHVTVAYRGKRFHLMTSSWHRCWTGQGATPVRLADWPWTPFGVCANLLRDRCSCRSYNFKV